MLRIAEQWHGSDLGRQRQGNEDNYFVRAPLFVVADGMGGAQAGEVASEMAVQSFDSGFEGGKSPGEALVRIIEDANRRIHEHSRSEERRAGMGTTLTAAYVGENAVTIAHVGDSRAYLWRDGDLIRLTRDHSLVGELVARGKLTEEQAEAHPQRSVITRALGPEPSVLVDVDVYGARDGDVFLLCSDGLTSMIHEQGLKPILEHAERLEAAGRELIAAANAAGGRDNITVILFRLEEVEHGRDDGGATAASESTTSQWDTFEGEAVTGPRQGVTRPEDHPQASVASDETEAEYRRSGTIALSAVRPREREEQPKTEEAPKRTAPPPKRSEAAPRRRRRRFPVGPVIGLLIAGLVVAGAVAGARTVYFLDSDEQRGDAVTLYRGLPVDLPLGVELYSTHRTSSVTLDEVPAARRTVFTERKMRSKQDAENLLTELEQGRIE